MTATVSEPSVTTFIAEAIDHYRRQQGFTPADLVARLGWPEGRLPQVLDSAGSPVTTDELFDLAQVLRVALATLVRGAEDLMSGNPIRPRSQVVWTLPVWATHFCIETPTGPGDQQGAGMWASRNAAGDSGFMCISTQVIYDEVSRTVTATFNGTPFFSGKDDRRLYSLAEARDIVAGRSDDTSDNRGIFRELLDAYDAAAD